jgi:hypothetical protein
VRLRRPDGEPITGSIFTRLKRAIIGEQFRDSVGALGFSEPVAVMKSELRRSDSKAAS